MNQDGGEVIGEGSYGCVFKPSFECTNSSANDLKVSKIIENESLEEEYTNIVGFNLKEIDPEKELFIYPDEPLCELSDLNLKIDNPNNCRIMTSNIGLINDRNKKSKIAEINDKLKIVNFSYHGEDLYNYKLTGSEKNKSNKTNKLIIAMLNIFYGIKKLTDSNIAHRDLKPQNILYDGDVIRMIDF
jgi:serine/threonine protein kinase